MSSVRPKPSNPLTSKGLRKQRRSAHVPTVLQMESAEYGAAALGMVLAHYGRFVPLEELRVACGVSRDGMNATYLAKAARAYGLVERAYNCELDELDHAKLPAIIFWNFNHFVVIDGIESNGYHLNDPAIGPRKVSVAEVDAAFTGSVI